MLDFFFRHSFSSCIIISNTDLQKSLAKWNQQQQNCRYSLDKKKRLKQKNESKKSGMQIYNKKM